MSTIVPAVPEKSGNTKQISPAVKWCFTWNNPPTDWEDLLTQNEKFRSSKKYMFQPEVGASGTPHIQGFIIFQRKLRPTSCGLSKKIHWEKMKGSVKDNIEYCSKSDTKTGATIVKNCRPSTALKLLQKKQFHPWQIKLLAILNEEVPWGDRSIYWIHEPTGKTGKSVFCKWLCAMKGAILTGGKAMDMKYQIVTCEQAPEIILFDLARPRRNNIDAEGLEEIKNGCFFSSKYESKMFIMNRPHVVIFSNFPPKDNELSKDKYKIFEIVENDLKKRDLGIKIIMNFLDE